MRAWPVLCSVLMIACETGTEDGTNPGTDEIADPSPYVVEGAESMDPTETTASVQAAMQSALDLTMTVNAAPVRDAYDEVMAYQGGGCPYYYATQDGNYWLDGCSAPSGARYDGYVFGLDSGDVVNPENGFITNTWYASGGATVVDPSGNLLEVGGIAAVQQISGRVGQGKGVPYFAYTSLLQGSFQWDGPSAAGTFLADGLDPDLQINLQEIPDFGRTNTLTGGFSGFDGGWAVAFANNLIFSATLGSSCESEIAGTVAVRSPAGEWFDVRFDGPPDDQTTVATADCDGCGTAYFQGQEFGEICVDFADLLGWGVTPW